eukprot:CAMPEP_0117419338 /NCGR_PEP_ID=MMETSP0758-20121206/927_1 /TAXON_ID=63605 /ORGANISM="Percolomonas cosmopolitus, Strain AE-1 (ATCC 50343)" /LENGTH=481 /DNA_ID=CAMNT_0005200357 /DNA_START=385 /DNA_END=1827 /DNA_ORIENTATION=+
MTKEKKKLEAIISGESRQLKRRLDYESKWAKMESLKDFGYTFTKEGFMVSIENEKQHFSFQDQVHYDWVGHHVTKYVQLQMKDKCNLIETSMKGSEEGEGKLNIMHTKNALTTTGTLMVIMPGAGVVKPGVWALSLCVNGPAFGGGLSEGSMFSYVGRAISEKMDVLITNPNENEYYDKESKTWKTHEYHKSPQMHTIRVYDEILANTKAKHIIIVAHSFGGVCTMELLGKRPAILKKLRAVVFTDSVHQQQQVDPLSQEAKDFLLKRASNYIQSNQVQGKPLGGRAGVNTISSGTTKHTRTSAFAYEPAWNFILLQLSLQLPAKAKLEKAQQLKTIGNDQFTKQKDFIQAISSYTMAIFLFGESEDFTPEQVRQAQDISLSCHVNIAAVALKQTPIRLDFIVEHIDRALSLDDVSPELKQKLRVKAYFRKASAYQQAKRFEKAEETLAIAQKEYPENDLLQAKAKQIKSQVAQLKNMQRQ